MFNSIRNIGAEGDHTVVFLLRDTGGVAFIGITILVLTEVIRNGLRGPKLSWKKVWTIFTKVCLTIYSIFSLFSVYVNDINKQKMLSIIFKHPENFFLP